MVDRLLALRRGATPALQKGDLPTQQVDGVPTLQQSGCPALPRRRQQCARSQVRAYYWPDLHRCASVGCCLRLTSHIDFGIPTRSRLRHRDLDDIRVPPQNSSRRLPGRPGQPQVLWSTTKSLWSTTGSLWSTTRSLWSTTRCPWSTTAPVKLPSGRRNPSGRRHTRRPDQSVAAVELPGQHQHHSGPLQLDEACRAALPL
ncbi:unnamed protein product [Closterium sp. NIES-53]